MSDILFVEEVAALTRVPAGTLRYWAHLGDRGPKSAKMGRRRVWRRADVDAWIDAQFAEAEAAEARRREWITRH